MLNALISYNDYNSPSALKLLEKDEKELLRCFWKVNWDLPTADSMAGSNKNHRIQRHETSLIQKVFKLAGGCPQNDLQHDLDPGVTAFENARICGHVVGIDGSNSFGNFDAQKMCDALSKSKLLANVSKFEIATLTSQIIPSVLIGYPQDLV